MNEAKITAALDACLLSDAEMKSGNAPKENFYY